MSREPFQRGVPVIVNRNSVIKAFTEMVISARGSFASWPSSKHERYHSKLNNLHSVHLLRACSIRFLPFDCSELGPVAFGSKVQVLVDSLESNELDSHGPPGRNDHVKSLQSSESGLRRLSCMGTSALPADSSCRQPTGPTSIPARSITSSRTE